MPCHCNCTGCCFPQQYSAIDKKKGPDVVVYKRGGTTYVYNLEHKWTFEEEIVLSKISRDNKRLFYKTWEGSLKYIDLTAEKDIQTIDSSVINFVISENGDVVYYIKRDLDVNQLFKWTKGKSSHVADEVDFVATSRDGKSVLYATSNNKMYLYINGKKAFEEERISIKQHKDLKEIYYVKDKNLYRFKSGKTEMLAEKVLDIIAVYDSGIYFLNTDGKYCYYDKKVHVLDNFISYTCYGENKPIMVFCDENNNHYIAEGRNIKRVKDLDNAKQIMFNKTCTKIFYLQNNSDLMIYDIKKEKSTLYAKDMAWFSHLYVTDKFIYQRDVTEKTCDLYLDKKLIASDINKTAIYSDKNGNILYRKDKDYSMLFSPYELYLYNGKESILIGDNITQYKYFDEKRILFKENSDTLYLYDGKNTIKIDDKVQNLYFPEKESYWDEDFFELYTLKAHF
jgi:hypothetical protein